jgi:hypothetical protein
MPSLRDQVRQRAKSRCEYCQLPQTCTVLPHEIDHILAQKHRGQTSLENLCLACAQCNASKGSNIAGYDPVTGKLTSLFNPRTHIWTEHFHWNGPTLVGTTPIARATISVLDINSPERVQHRRLLIAAGLFPLSPHSG